MSVSDSELDRLWLTASLQPVVSAFRTADVGVETPNGPVLLGVDASGHRHLLVPMASGHTLRHDIEGRAVALRQRTLEDERSYRTYASLELVAGELAELFTALCVEILERIAAEPERSIGALRETLRDWRTLLADNRQLLTTSALAGLFGELDLLRSLIIRDPGAVAFWTGPAGSAQDFHRGADAVEVKVTTSSEGRVIRIHGVDQLDITPPGRLLLSWSRVRSDRGVSVPDLVADIAARTDDVSAFHALLRRVGYVDADREVYSRHRFEVIERRRYAVGAGFPRIVPAALQGDAVLAGVGPVEYSVDLDAGAAEGHRVEVDPVDLLLEPA